MHRAQVQTVSTPSSAQREYALRPLECAALPRLEGLARKALQVPKDMSDVHLLLWFLAQHIACAANKNTNIVNPSKIRATQGCFHDTST